ncbi:class I SAM-dependent methyltransferase [Butyrivibrio fibrisolvens]|uniref:class I SAM-dependent methyltransferase n=1 Tax=Pseudobutyrivibrio ruminis TaxID=46206 RepID=UPI000413DFDA|nr:class I SAM-dependent methyltransferase [Pseudobutyrivibrio ruminis]MDC7279104.1 class I SAM-dependent methyltransferase [Butyrivibrio fibrisolvens]
MKLIIVGAGKTAEQFLKYKTKKGVEIPFVCDNDSAKWGEKICGYRITPLEEILKTNYDLVLLGLCNGGALIELINQLDSLGVPREKIKFSYDPSFIRFCESDLDELFEIPKFEYEVKFEKNKITPREGCKGETEKSHDRREREGFFEKYCQGEGLDIGCGEDPIVPGVSGWDILNGDAQYLNGIDDESFDYVYSSHCLEHMRDVRVAIKNWYRVVRKGGYLIIAVPHRDLYEKRKCLPSRWNGDHKHMFLLGVAEAPDTLDLEEEVKQSISEYDLIYAKVCDEGHTITDPLIHSDGEYQIEMVIKKK